MTQRGNGYNNPAFCNQYDNSLFDYQYVPEIDPDSPDLERRGSYRHSRQIPPRQLQQNSSKVINNSNSNSDESNGSIIVEECNNRRVTLICEKRPKIHRDENGGYVHDISLESADSNGEEMEDINRKRGLVNAQAARKQANLRAPRQASNCQMERDRSEQNRNPRQGNFVQPSHRYEELDPPSYRSENRRQEQRHRYAEIDDELETEGVHFSHRIAKPRAPSPIYYHSENIDFSPDFGSSPIFNRCYNEAPGTITYTSNSPTFSTNFGGSPDFTYGSDRHTNSPSGPPDAFEMSDFSPPLQDYGSKRQPPVGASATHVPEQALIQKPAQNTMPRMKSSKNMQEVFRRSPCKPQQGKNNLLTPRNTVKITKSAGKASGEEKSGRKNSVRRDISSSFICEQKGSSPYRATTQPISNRNTAIITPIFQRKFADLTSENSNFQRVSKIFQSTGNVLKGDKDGMYQVHPQNNFNIPPFEQQKMKRNRSVPNFHAERRTPSKSRSDAQGFESPQSAFRKLDYPSPTKSPERFSPLSKSRLSLLENMKSCPSSLDEEEYPPSPSGCLILASVVQLLAGMVACGICFYLLSKLGRRYYLDLGTLAGFVSMVLGALGFRSQRWKWLPNRNYVSGYVILAAFSILNAASLVLIIAMRPMAGDPVLDICAGAICAISVIVIGVSFTGLTLSGCCKTPPPDNRVTSA